MRFQRALAFVAMLSLTGCKPKYTPPEQPMPANTVLLSEMMRELSAQPGFTQALLEQIDGAKKGDSKRGPTLLTPTLADELRKRILGKDWAGLDRFPGWTMREVNPTVRVVGHVAGKNQALEADTAVHPGATPDAEATKGHLDLGPYMLERGHVEEIYEPSKLPGFTTDGIVTSLGAGVVRGDGPNALAPEHAESQRLADVLNRLAANGLEGAKLFQVKTQPGDTPPEVGHPLPEWEFVSKPEDLLRALVATGHTVTVTDSRYFANFGHFHFSARGSSSPAQDVMMPFWLNTEIAVPGTGGVFTRPRALLIPVSHAELEWHIRSAAGSSGPKINADVSWYFGIDGKAEWRTMDTLDQAWVMKRDAHTYTGEQAVEVTRLTGLMTVAYMHQHAKRPALPFGGYYALGVCQDWVSAVEKRMTGATTLYPNTADASLFDDARDAEVNAMIEAIPKDRAGARPEPARVFGSLPTTNFDTLMIPGLASDVKLSYAAWKDGTLKRTHGRLFYAAMYGFIAIAAGAVLWGVRKRRR